MPTAVIVIYAAYIAVADYHIAQGIFSSCINKSDNLYLTITGGAAKWRKK